MKLREDQLKLQSLLKETITVLCKNGVQFSQGFVIDALIGITTDNQSTFLIKLEETIGNTNAGNEQACGIEAGGRPNVSSKRPPDGGTDCTPSKRSRSEVNCEPEHSLDVSAEKFVSCNQSTSLANSVNSDAIKTEDRDTVFVKQEPSSIRYAQADQSRAFAEEADVKSDSFVGQSTYNSTDNTDIRSQHVHAAITGSQHVQTATNIGSQHVQAATNLGSQHVQVLGVMKSNFLYQLLFDYLTQAYVMV